MAVGGRWAMTYFTEMGTDVVKLWLSHTLKKWLCFLGRIRPLNNTVYFIFIILNGDLCQMHENRPCLISRVFITGVQAQLFNQSGRTGKQQFPGPADPSVLSWSNHFWTLSIFGFSDGFFLISVYYVCVLLLEISVLDIASWRYACYDSWFSSPCTHPLSTLYS